MVRRLGAQMGRRLSKIAHVIVPVHVFECAGASLAAMDGHCATESARPLFGPENFGPSGFRTYPRTSCDRAG